MFLFDLFFRPYVLYSDKSSLRLYIDRLSRLACVAEIKISISDMILL